MDLRSFGAFVFAFGLLTVIQKIRQDKPWHAWGVATAIGFAAMIDYVVAAIR